MKPIRILSPNIDLLAEIDDYESLQFTRSWHGVGEFELRINRHKQHTDKLIKNNLILLVANKHKVGIIKHREIELNEEGKASENWLIRGFALKSVVGQRLTVPPPHTGYDNKQGNAETVMKHYVNNHCVNPADINRKITMLALAPNQNRGLTVSWQSRFKNLAEELTDISLNSGIGWNVVLDFENKKWVFEVYEGRNLTANQSINPPVILSPEFDSLKNLSFVESELNYKNVAYTGGQGEDVDREIVEIGNTNDLDRLEIFIDARDVADTPQLIERGQQGLLELQQEIFLEGQVLTRSPFKYEQDYDLGDIVTVQNKAWGVTLDTRITEIKEIYEPDGFSIEAVFGQSRPTLISKIKQELDIPMIEKSTGGGSNITKVSELENDANYTTATQVSIALIEKADTIHNHGIIQVNGLQSALDSKANQINLTSLNDTVIRHSAEITSHKVFFTRDLSLAGEQVITLLPNRKAKHITAFAMLIATNGISMGFVAENDQGSIYQHSNAGTGYSGDAISTVKSDGEFRGEVFIESGQIKINWKKIGDVTGTVAVQLIAYYHD